MVRRKQIIGYGKMKKYYWGTEGFRKKAGGPVVRTRPGSILFNRRLSTGEPMKTVGTRENFANRLKGMRRHDGKKAALAYKREANALTRASIKET